MSNENILASKHTPGPWTLDVVTTEEGVIRFYVLGNEKGYIVSIDGGVTKTYVLNAEGVPTLCNEEVNDANAHMISAAPEAIEFIADLMPTFELMKATGLFDAEAVDKVISDAETILKKAYNL